MSERDDAIIEAAQEQLMRRHNQEVAMAHNAHGLSHDDLMRLRAIEAAARELLRVIDDNHCPELGTEAPYALRAALEGK